MSVKRHGKTKGLIITLAILGIVIISTLAIAILNNFGGSSSSNNVPPVANAGSDQRAYVGVPVSFIGTGTDSDGHIILYRWDFDGDGIYDFTNLTSGIAIHTYDTAGTYLASLTVYDNNGANNTDSCLITVKEKEVENHPPIADAGDDQTVFSNESIALNGAGTDSDGSIIKYEWDFNGDGTYNWSSTTTGSTTHTYNTAGTYYAVLRVTDDKGATDTDTCIISVNEKTENNPPVADAGSDQSVSVGDSVSFVGSGMDSDGSIVKYEWDFNGDGTYNWSSTTTGSTTHIYNTAGTYYAVLRVTDDKGATDTDTCIIDVNEQGGASAEIIDDNSYTDSSGYLYVVGIAKNTGTVNLNYVKISGTFYDSNGSVVDTEFTYTMLDILKPDQKSPFKIMLSEPSNYDHYSLSISYSTTTDNAYADLQIQGVTDHTDQYGYSYIDGEVHNSGSADVTYVKVVAIIYDSSGKIIDADFTYTDPSDISAGGTESFEFMINTADLPGTIDHYELQVQCS